MSFLTHNQNDTRIRLPISTCVMAVLCIMQCCDGVDAKVLNRRTRLQFQESGLNSDPRIVGGTPAVPGDYPFYASTIQPILCGSTLIYEDILLTAAHCGGGFLAGANIGGVLLNGMDAVEVVSVDLEFPHPDYDSVTRINDIMLVKLTDPATSPLVTINSDPTVPAVGDVVTVIGFGDTTDGGDPSPMLLMVNVDVFSDQFCDDLYNVFEPPTMICAGTVAGGRDSCQGDSGGPLFTSANVQIGIVSLGNGCAQANIPAIYTEVAAFQSFIRQGICDLSDNPPTTCGPTIQPNQAPVVAPVDAPVSPPVDSPVVAPVSPPVDAPVVAPIETPVAVPADTPVVAPVASPVNTPEPPSTIPTPDDTTLPTVTMEPTLATMEPTEPVAPTDAPTPSEFVEPTFEPTFNTQPPKRMMMMMMKSKSGGGMMMMMGGGMMMGGRMMAGGEMMRSGKGYIDRGRKGHYGKGFTITSNDNIIFTNHHLEETDDNTGLDTVMNLLRGSSELNSP